MAHKIITFSLFDQAQILQHVITIYSNLVFFLLRYNQNMKAENTQ